MRHLSANLALPIGPMGSTRATSVPAARLPILTLLRATTTGLALLLPARDSG